MSYLLTPDPPEDWEQWLRDHPMPPRRRMVRLFRLRQDVRQGAVSSPLDQGTALAGDDDD